MDEYKNGYDDGFKKAMNLFESSYYNLECFYDLITKMYNKYVSYPTYQEQQTLKQLLQIAYLDESNLEMFLINIAGKEYEDVYKEKLNRIHDGLNKMEDRINMRDKTLIIKK